MLTQLSDGPSARTPPPVLEGGVHRSRLLLQRLLDSDDTDDDAAATELRAEYEEQARIWTAWTAAQDDYTSPWQDVATRRPDLIASDDVVLEVGVGTGQLTHRLAQVCGRLVALDIAWEMVRQVPATVARAQADVRRLPLMSDSVDVVAGMNAVPCWREFRRVLRSGGRIVWLSSFGLDTPIVVRPEEVHAAHPDADVTWARAGHGFWIVVEGGACTE